MTDLIDRDELEGRLESCRTQLTGYCYRMLGSASEAEDAVQDTFIRAWRGYDRFEGRSSLRSWLYKIATNVCLDMSTGRQRRALPMDLAGPVSADMPIGAKMVEAMWVGPAPDAKVLDRGADPSDIAASRDTVRLAFIAALQFLPPRQRAVLILREVLCFHADEVAQLLETSVASVNSALQRARATLAERGAGVEATAGDLDETQRELLRRYMAAFEAYDMDALTSLLADDATMSMPPYDMWLQGTRDIVGWMIGQGGECRGSRLVPVDANGSGGFGQYRLGPDGSFVPWSLQVIETEGGQVTGICSFLDTETLFPLFGLPDTVH